MEQIVLSIFNMKPDANAKTEWDLVINPKPALFHFGIKELFRYRDLITLFVKRDLIAQYKQTLLGPAWLILQPLLWTVFYSVIFGNFAKFDAGSIPYPIFILSGFTIWNFFSSSLNKTSTVFVSNAGVFGKVYFPRLTVPVAALLSNGFAFMIQCILLVLLLLIYTLFFGYTWTLDPAKLLLFPVLLVICGAFGLGAGLIVSSLTTKYRDLTFLVGFALQFGMFFSEVVFPIAKFSPEIQRLFNLNPLLHIINSFRAVFINAPVPEFHWLLYSFCFTVVVVILGMLVFNKVEKSFMDTV